MTTAVTEGTRRAARNVVVVTGGELLGKAATLVFTIVAARALGPDGFGAFSYALAFGLLLCTLPSWGFDVVLARRGSRDAADVRPALAQALVLRSVLAVPVGLVGGVAGALLRPTHEARVALVLVLLACLSDTYADAGRAAAGSVEKRGRTVLALVAQRLANAVAGVALLAAGGGLVAISAGYLASSLLGLALTGGALARLRLLPDWSAVDRPALLAMWRASVVLGIDTVVAMALFRMDAVMLGALDDDRAVAAYSVAYRLLETVLFLSWAVSRATYPAMVRASDGRPLADAAEKSIAIAGAVFVPYGVVLLVDGRPLLDLLFGGEYLDEGTSVLRWLAFGPLAFGVSYLLSAALSARGRAPALLLGSAVAAAVNVGGNLVLIPLLSGVGAAVMTLVAFTVEGAVLLVALARTGTRVGLGRALLVPVLAALPLLAVLVLLSLPVLIEAPLGGLAYVAAWTAVSLRLAPEQVAVVRALGGRR